MLQHFNYIEFENFLHKNIGPLQKKQTKVRIQTKKQNKELPSHGPPFIYSQPTAESQETVS